MKFRTALLAASMLMLGGVLTSAQTPDNTTMPETSSLTANGTIVSSSSTSVVVRLDDGTERTFTVDSNSSVPTGLAAGTRVSVRYASETGGYRALSVMTTGTTTPASTTDDANTLPSTASALPLIAVAGLVALMAAMLMGAAQRRA